VYLYHCHIRFCAPRPADAIFQTKAGTLQTVPGANWQHPDSGSDPANPVVMEIARSVDRMRGPVGKGSGLFLRMIHWFVSNDVFNTSLPIEMLYNLNTLFQYLRGGMIGSLKYDP